MGKLNLIILCICALKLIEAQQPDVVYIEILCIVDHSTFLLHNSNITEIQEYFLIFWNGVDLRFKILEDPQIRISIAGFLILQTQEESAFLENNRVGSTKNGIDTDKSLDDLSKYLYLHNNSLPPYDIAVAITKLDMLSKMEDDDFDPDTIGFAYEGRVCFTDQKNKVVRSVAIVEDSGAFSGVNGAIHELGHLLNAPHDGDPALKHNGGPGAEKCNWEDGYIMGEATLTENGFKWSPCSIEAIRDYMKQPKTSCLHNVPSKSEKLSDDLPGKIVSLDEQCYKLHGGRSCFEDSRVCENLFCSNITNPDFCHSDVPAADGSPCGPKKRCWYGQCVEETSL